MNKNLHLVFLSVMLLLASVTTQANDKAYTEKLVSTSLVTLNNFVADPTMKSFQSQIQRAKGFLIIPYFIKGGFVVGGSGGTGVLLRKNTDVDEWSYPAFYTMGSVTLGLQIGGEVAEVILLFMNNNGMDALLSTKLQLGADASIAAGPVGTGTQRATSDILIYSRGKGAFGGLTLEGALVTSRDPLNNAYYGGQVSPLDILISGKAGNTQADALRSRITEISQY